MRRPHSPFPPAFLCPLSSARFPPPKNPAPALRARLSEGQAPDRWACAFCAPLPLLNLNEACLRKQLAGWLGRRALEGGGRGTSLWAAWGRALWRGASCGYSKGGWRGAAAHRNGGCRETTNMGQTIQLPLVENNTTAGRCAGGSPSAATAWLEGCAAACAGLQIAFKGVGSRAVRVSRGVNWLRVGVGVLKGATR
jgi:hypothetical protein